MDSGGPERHDTQSVSFDWHQHMRDVAREMPPPVSALDDFEDVLSLADFNIARAEVTSC